MHRGAPPARRCVGPIWCRSGARRPSPHTKMERSHSQGHATLEVCMHALPAAGAASTRDRRYARSEEPPLVSPTAAAHVRLWGLVRAALIWSAQDVLRIECLSSAYSTSMCTHLVRAQGQDPDDLRMLLTTALQRSTVGRRLL